jgi:hypothetical protein
VLSVFLTAATTKVEDIDGAPPWGVLSVFLAVATTEVEDIDGGPPGGDVDISDSGHHWS